MDLKKYQAFLTAVDSGSFAKTAEILDYTPSGISHMMSSLEQELGLPLLHRMKSGVAATRDGERLIPIIRELLRRNEQLEQTVSEINGLSSGNIIIGAYLSVSAQWLPQVISAFQADYPRINIALMEGVWDEVNGWMQERKTDFSIFSYRPELKGRFIPLREDPLLAVLPREHPLAGEAVYPLERCGEERFIMPGLGHDADVTALLKSERLNPKICFSVMDNYTAMAMIQSNLGMSIMNELIITGRRCDVAILPLDPPRSITLGIAVPEPEELSPAATKFISYLMRMIGDEQQDRQISEKVANRSECMAKESKTK